MMAEIDVVQRITDENKQLRQAIKLFADAAVEYKQVLRYYADPANWTGKNNIARLDRGEMARQTLKKEF